MQQDETNEIIKEGLGALKSKKRFQDSAHQQRHLGTENEGIYTRHAYNQFKDTVKDFGHWVKHEFQCTTLKEAFAYIGSYFLYVVNTGVEREEALQRVSGALSKIYGHTREDLYKAISKQLLQ